MKKFSKRSIALSLAVALIAAVAAVAYWTSGGTGTGSASAGTTANITVNQSTVLTAMYPGDTPQTISGNFSNTNSGPVYVGTVTAAISGVTKAAGAPAGTCDATDFTLATPAMTVNAQVPTGTGGAWTGAKLSFNNKTATNQDACKGATVALSYTIS
jgi:hypothetical protein